MIRNIFERYKAGTPARQVANVADANWMRNFFNDLQGIGCRVEMPEHLGGLGCRIVVDGTTDVPYPDPTMNPYGESTNIFIAEVTGVSGGWSFEEREHDGSESFAVPSSPRSGDCDEINGISAPTTSVSFLAYIFETNGYYSFAFPMPQCEVADARKVLRVSSEGIPEWGCVLGGV